MAQLTDRQRRILEEGAKHRDRVVRPHIGAGYDGLNTRRNVQKLLSLGLIEPSPYGDHYITAAGLAEVSHG